MNYRFSKYALMVSFIIVIAGIVFNLDFAEKTAAFLISFERYELDELMVALPILALGLALDGHFHKRDSARASGQMRAIEEIRTALHDDVGQSLTSIGYLASALKMRLQELCKTSSDDLDLAKLVTWSNQLVEQTASVQQALRAHGNTLDFERVGHIGLYRAVQELAALISGTYQVSCIVSDEKATAEKFWALIEPEKTEQIYAIVRELLTNAVNHGHPRHIEIKFAEQYPNLSVEIFNDGQGFSVEKGLAKGGFGLRSIKRRAAGLQAQLQFATEKDGNVLTGLVYTHHP
jgi:signal transduction histidine kinase